MDTDGTRTHNFLSANETHYQLMLLAHVLAGRLDYRITQSLSRSALIDRFEAQLIHSVQVADRLPVFGAVSPAVTPDAPAFSNRFTRRSRGGIHYQSNSDDAHVVEDFTPALALPSYTRFTLYP